MSQQQRPRRHLRICPACTGYMVPSSAVQGQAVGRRHWKDETFHRSFGGNQLRQFTCEKCSHTETFQIDELAHIKEEDS